MASRYSPIDLTRLPMPDAVEMLDYEATLDERKDHLIAQLPEIAPVLTLESDPLTKLLEEGSYRELILRGRVNDSVRAVTLAFAQGTTLDNLAALVGVSRQVVVEPDPLGSPPVAEVLEDDVALRGRTQLAWEGLGAGTASAYLFDAISADGRVRDASVIRAGRGEVLVTILSHEGDGVPTADLLATVAAALEPQRTLCDDITVAAPTFVDFDLAATIYTAGLPEADLVAEMIIEDVTAYVQDELAVGRVVRRGALLARLYQSGVDHAELHTPLTDIDPGRTGVARALTVDISFEAV